MLPISAPVGSALRLRTRRLEAVTAIDIDVSDAHTAPFLRPRAGVPLPRAGALSGIGLRGDAIGRRTRAGGVGGRGRSAVGLAGGTTGGSTGIAWGRGITWSRGVGGRGGIRRRRRGGGLGVWRVHAHRR